MNYVSLGKYLLGMTAGNHPKKGESVMRNDDRKRERVYKDGLSF